MRTLDLRLPSAFAELETVLGDLNRAIKSLTASARLAETALAPFSFLTGQGAGPGIFGEPVQASAGSSVALADAASESVGEPSRPFSAPDSGDPLLRELASAISQAISSALKIDLSPLKTDVQQIKNSFERSGTKLDDIAIKLGFISMGFPDLLAEVKKIAEDVDWIADFMADPNQDRSEPASSDRQDGFDPARALGSGVDGLTVARELKAKRPGLWALISALIFGSDLESEGEPGSIPNLLSRAETIRNRATRVEPRDYQGLEEQQKYTAIAKIDEEIKELEVLKEKLEPFRHAEKFSPFVGLNHPYTADTRTRDEAVATLQQIDRYIEEIQKRRQRILEGAYDQSSLRGPGTQVASAEMQKVHMEVDIKSDHPVIMRRLDNNPNVVLDMYSGPRMIG